MKNVSKNKENKMLNGLNKNQLYFSIATSVVIFMFLNFSIGPSFLFGIAEFIQNETGYFFGVDINTLDYFLISLIPIFGLLLNSKGNRNSFTEILKANAIIAATCVATFTIGVFILFSKVGSPGENPIIPQSISCTKLYSSHGAL